MYNSVILALAQQDINDAAIWYNAKRKGLGRKFIKALRKKVRFIQQNPKAANVRYDNIRTSTLDAFPFMIHYFVDDNNKEVVISAVLHTSRNPDIWTKR